MKQHILFTTVVLWLVWGTLPTEAFSKQYYVHPQGDGNGASWRHATSDLAGLLAKTQAGDEIWVAAGVYKPSMQGNRQASFLIPSGVALYGGFAGGETSLTQRSVGANKTMLSGDIGQVDNASDNSYTVVSFETASAETILDGFYVVDGHADANVEGADRRSCGGGIFIHGASGESSPVVRNCIIKDNYALHGAGVYVYAEQATTAPQFSNCAIKENHAELYGGALLNNSYQANCETRIQSCHFIQNKAMFGGAISNQGYRHCVLNLTGCQFKDNFASFKESVIHSENKGAAKGEVAFADCTFEGNTSTVGREQDEEEFKEGSGTLSF